MRHKVHVQSIFGILFLVLSVFLVPGTVAQETEDSLTQIDSLFASGAERGMFSGSVLVAQGDTILMSEGYGDAVRQWNVPNSPETRFRITNQTELFIATAIMMLQDRGLLSVDDLICSYLDDCPDTWQDITIHHLLSHSAGIPFLLDDIVNLEPALPANNNRLLELLANEPLKMTPGDEFYYGSDYVILGQIIKSVSDQSHQIFIRQNILEPLELTDTGFDSPDEIVERLADGYQNDQRQANYIHVSNLGASLGMYASVEDLFRFHQALRTEQLVSGETWQTMSTPKITLRDDLAYGYGMWLGNMEGHPGIGDNWWGLGYSNSRLYLLNEEITIIILTNQGDVDPDLYNRLIIQALLSED